MKQNRIPNTDIKVSKICLGTMTFGNQNTEADGHEQMDYAIDNGVNFFDTAELYPVPANAKTQGETDRIIGSWFKKLEIGIKSFWPLRSLDQENTQNTFGKI